MKHLHVVRSNYGGLFVVTGLYLSTTLATK